MAFRKVHFIIICFSLLTVNVNAQNFNNLNDLKNNNHFYKSEFRKNQTYLAPQSPTLPLALGLVTALYLINPIIIGNTDGVNLGLTKEISVGFGYFGEYRIGAEYSLIFKGQNKNQLRISGKYDNLLSDIKPSNMLQTTQVISIGGGFFTDFNVKGFFPEISYGFSIRNDKLLFYPHIKARYTVLTDVNQKNFADISFGFILGIANPFIDLNIRNNHGKK
ncbi:MAG TPA: hypothetical protein DEP28_05710 [Bacteroidetes bacterium]|nr:hypothetical protein [Bacteroidota bacterium]HCN38384.1 hypothetical protein [Bacteroidota bacterium]